MRTVKLGFGLLLLAVASIAFGQANPGGNTYVPFPPTNITSPANNQCLVYQSSSARWVNGSCSSGGGVTVTGSPANGNLAFFSGAGTISNGNLSGDCSTAGTGVLTCTKINGTAFSGLSTGLLKNTTGTGVPSIAVAGTDYQAPITAYSQFPTINTGTILGNSSGSTAAPSALTGVPASVAAAGTIAGIACDGTTDDSTAINAALSSGIKQLVLPAASCRAASTISIPAGVLLSGFSFSPGNAPTGSQILCDLTVTPCVQISGVHGQVSLSNITIGRAAGTPATTTVGIQVTASYNVQLQNVMSYNHGICYQWTAQPAAGTGLGGTMLTDYAGKCEDAYIDVQSWPELRILGGRYGMNGTGDYAANAFIRLEGGVTGTAGGPNTIYAQNAQFNQGSSSVSHFMEFVNLGSGGVPSIDATDYKVDLSHIEGISGAVVYSDSTWNILNRVTFTNNSINSTGIPFFALNAATQPSVINVSNNTFAGTDITLTGHTSAPITACVINGNSLTSGSIVLVGISGSTCSVFNNSVAAGVNVSGVWGSLSVFGDTYVGGSLTNTATGVVNVIEPTSTAIGTAWNVSIPSVGGFETVQQLTGLANGFSVDEHVLNNGAGTTGCARTQWATNRGSVDAYFGVCNLAAGNGYTLIQTDTNASGVRITGGIVSAGTKFTTSGCSISSTTGGATAGTFTLGANSCTAVITMDGATGITAPNGWSCDAHDRTAPTVLIGGESSSTQTTASITIPAGAGATDVISFSCTGY